MRLAEEGGARKVVPLPISIAAHSPLMASVAETFAMEIDRTTVTAPMKPVIGNVSAKPMTTSAEIKSDLRAQLTAPVRWTESVRYMLDQGVDSFYEVGPGSVLLGLVKRINRNANRIQFDLNP
jgi:[acyl-carrier-protein] S-malonyltransferase